MHTPLHSSEVSESNGRSCGLDFGTSNTCVVDSREDAGQGISLPSLIFFPEQEGLPGMVGEAAAESYMKQGRKGRFFQAIKSVVADPSIEETMVHGRWRTIAELVSLIIKEAKDALEAQTGETVEQVVLGRPVVFVHGEAGDKTATERLADAAGKAGFRNVEFELEPIAAAYVYERRLRQEQLVLVVDLGGGTSDFTVARLGPDRIKIANRMEDILGVTGVDIGGNKFDGRILWNKGVSHFGHGSTYSNWNKMMDVPSHIHKDLCDWEMFPFLNTNHLLTYLRSIVPFSTAETEMKSLIEVIGKNQGYSLFKACESAKIDATTTGEGVVAFANATDTWEERLPCADLESITDELVEQIWQKGMECLSAAGLAVSDIDRVFLTGGSSLLTNVRRKFQQGFGAEVIDDGDAFLSVAKGLALSAAMKFG